MSRKSFITTALAAAAIAAPAAQATNPLGHPGGPTSVGLVTAQSSYLGHPGGPTSVGIVLTKAASGATSLRSIAGGPVSVGFVQGKPTSSKSYFGRVGGPTGVGLVQLPTPSSTPSFAWDDAAIGAGFALGVTLLAAGGFLATRRRATLAHSNS